jgi:hypothetical protein
MTRVGGQLIGRAGVVVADRHIGGLPWLAGEGHADQARGDRVERVGFKIEGEGIRAGEAFAPALERGHVEHGLVGVSVQRGHGRRRRRRLGRRGRFGRACVEFLQPGLEFEPREQLPQRVPVRRGAVEVVGIDVERHVAAHGGQIPVQRQRVQRLAQALAHLATHLVGVGDHAVERAVFLQPLGGGLGADLGHARDVVHRVAGQSQKVGDQLRRHAELVHHAGDVQHRVAHGVDQAHVVVHQLRQVLVGRRDQHLLAARRGAPRQRADHVVRLHALDHQQRQAERPHQRLRRRDLHGEIIRHRRAVGLVVGEALVAKRRTLGVEHHRDVGVRVVALQPAQHVDDAIGHAGRLALRVGQRRQGVEGTEQVGRAVH